ncbi:hypothetical protein J2Z69_001858 [Paenibacillus shirakamiensis]|uniref:Uncharacterized protein n=2 Tax=Paenibacillus shirakamiensis TaxID=1265935 RepID=A0ABS4JGI6_9BACL|nr:hypothetical protein [Paenibacillus shirakamiensis]
MFIGYELYVASRIIRNFRRDRSVHSHPMDTLRKALEHAFPSSKMIPLLIHDISMLYYVLWAWRKSPYLQKGSRSFHYHTQSTWLITIMILSKVLLIEGIGLHFLLMQWSGILAWIVSLGNVYLIILLIADYRAMCLNPILVSPQQIRVQYGIQLYAVIDIENIESVTRIQYKKLSKKDAKTTFLPEVIEPNIRIQFKSEFMITRLFGRRQAIDQMYLFLDDPLEFEQECSTIIQQKKDS